MLEKILFDSPVSVIWRVVEWFGYCAEFDANGWRIVRMQGV